MISQVKIWTATTPFYELCCQKLDWIERKTGFARFRLRSEFPGLFQASESFFLSQNVKSSQNVFQGNFRTWVYTFQRPRTIFQDLPVLENTRSKFKFLGLVQTLENKGPAVGPFWFSFLRTLPLARNPLKTVQLAWRVVLGLFDLLFS